MNYELLKFGDKVTITVGSVIFLLIGILIARLLNYGIRRVLKAFFTKRQVDVGRSYTILTLVKYLIYIIVFISVINVIGIQLNYLLAGSAALLVGIGIGLQGTFNDFFSGIILLIDGTIEVGDVLQVNNQIGRVKFIGLRTSKIETLDAHIIIFPNSQLINNQVNNLTHKESPIRLSVDIGVSYGSDIRQVENTLLDVIKPFSKFKMNYTPSVFLVSYGDSSINFRLHFFSSEVFRSDKIRSDVRKAIWIAFKREGIQIPFPQRDIWIKNSDQ